MLDAGYVYALEKRASWLRWAVESGRQAWTEIGKAETARKAQAHYEIFPLYLNNLEAGDTFFMNKKFGLLVDHARQGVPDDLTFNSSWLQSREGFMWLETPFSVPKTILNAEGKEMPLEVNGIPVRVSAVGWVPLEEGKRLDSGRVTGPGATEFLTFQDFQLHNDNVLGFGCWSYFMLQNGDKLIDRIRQFESLSNPEFGQYKIDRIRDELHEIRWTYTAMYLMAQRLSMTVRHETDRHTRRRAEHENKPVAPFIRVVTLRRMEEQRKLDNRTAQVIDWQWQWEVRGHWRNQFFPSTNEHKPVFVEAYIKGPEDKPIKPTSHKIFVARR